MFLYSAARCCANALLIEMEHISRAHQHNARFYLVVMIGTPAILAALSIASEPQVGQHDHCQRLHRVRLASYGLAAVRRSQNWTRAPVGDALHPLEFPLLIIVPPSS